MVTISDAFVDVLSGVPVSEVAVSLLEKRKSQYRIVKDNKIKLTPEERAKVVKEKAVWNFGTGTKGKRKATPAVWKGKDGKGKVWYCCNTHRAAAMKPTLKGAISEFHRFIKGTA